jgi:hypothetical protein
MRRRVNLTFVEGNKNARGNLTSLTLRLLSRPCLSSDIDDFEHQVESDQAKSLGLLLLLVETFDLKRRDGAWRPKKTSQLRSRERISTTQVGRC